jgi:Gas vesicle synthesis protein GvpL/GvpF
MTDHDTDSETDTATYLYALVRAARAPKLARASRGVPGAERPRVLDAGGGLWLVAATVPLAAYGEDALERGLKDLNWVSDCAVAHEAVIEALLAADAIVPMKLFTLFRSDARALEHIARRRRTVERVLARVAGCVEWGVRVTLDERAALAEAARAAGRAAPPTSGAGFLLRKKTLADAARKISSETRGRVDGLYDALGAHAEDARRRPPLEAQAHARLVLDAAYLVRAGRVARFRGAVKSHAARLGKDGYQVTLTGPWPPYNFVQGGA